jgi:hypothetical protein
MQALAELAHSRGVTHLRGEVLADNVGMNSLLRKFGAEIVPDDDASIITYEWDLSVQADR